MTVRNEDGEASENTPLPFSFTGGTREYFKIWIVNVLLVVLTLGIYSAWAKVRTKKYFYRHTWLQGSTFDYIGEPRDILARRILGLGLFLLCALRANRSSHAGLALTALAVLALPWLLTSERIFDVRHSVGRDVRFDWKSSRGEAVVVFFLPLLCLVTFGLALPYYSYRRERFLVAQSLHGTTPLELDASLRDFCKIYLKAFAVVMAGAVVSIVLVAILETPESAAGPNVASSVRALAVPVLLWVSVTLLYTGAWGYPKTALGRLVVSESHAGRCRLDFTPRSSLPLALELSNAAAVVVSLGLLLPWARIRRARHAFERLTLRTEGGLDGYLASDPPLPARGGVEVASGSTIEERGRAAIREISWRLGLTAVVVAIAIPALRYTLVAPPQWLDDLIGTALVCEFLILFLTTLILPIEVPLVALVGLGMLLRGHWFLRRERGRVALRPWCTVILWGLLLLHAPVLNATPRLTAIYAATLAFLALTHFLEWKAESGRWWRSRGGVASIVIVIAVAPFSVISSMTVVDTGATLSWIVLGAVVCLLTPSRLRFPDACAGLLVLALVHQAFVTISGLRDPMAASNSHRIVLGKGDAYSFCEMPDEKRLFVALPTCMGEDVAKCRDDVIAEYATETFTLERRYAPFDDSFEGRMLHLVCLQDSILVGMSFTSVDGSPRKENVMELSTRDGTVLRRDVVGPGVGHRLLRDPDGSAVSIVSEYSSVIRRYSLDHRDQPPQDIDVGESGLQARFSPFTGSLQTEVDAVRPSRGTGFFAEWIGGQRVSEVDLSTGQVVARYVTNDGGNHSLAIDAAYDRLIVTSLWGIDVIDLRTGRPIFRRRTEMGPRLPIVDTRRNLVYVSTTLGNHIWVFDRRTFALKGKLVVGVGGRNAHLTSDGRYLLTGGGGRHVAWELDWHARDWVEGR